MPQVNKISKKTFESTPQPKTVTITPAMRKMCVEVNTAKYQECIDRNS